ncbi:nuclear pore complex protein NUP43 isoform X2 [Abrus precatorius]|uniref:Nuclear pore complex protein NUP43 isoform X2 n=1 Tax=Abrus precatorius TaxID=3816 RepID=A0A8B8JE57_ABRPR|nr:nuclear pore complex protein NUP43 isoform X2 [Abrus precatorius]
MAVTASSEIHRFPQYKYVDAVRWLPPLSAFDRFAVLALFDFDSDVSSIEIHSFKSNPLSLEPQSSWVSPSRVSSLKTSQFLQKTIIVASTSSGSLHFLFSDSTDALLESEVSVPEGALHSVPASCVDLMDGGVECVTVGEDGRVNLVTVGNSNLNYRRLFDSGGLVSYTSAKWASPMEFATGGYGFSLQWWDQRKPGGPVSQFKGNWDKKLTSGIVHSIDIHPSRKHTCLAGGSLGTVFAWDLRWQQQPIILSGAAAGVGNSVVQSISESEVWEVQYDRCIKSNSSSTRILPSMICSEDGILAVIEQGEEPIELLAEPCAINSFDIDRHNPSVSGGR